MKIIVGLICAVLAGPTGCIVGMSYASASPNANLDKSACTIIASLATKRRLDTPSIALTKQDRPDKLQVLPDATNEGNWPGDQGAFVDLAGDGNLIHVLLGKNNGMASEEEYYFYDKNWNYIPQPDKHRFDYTYHAGTLRRLMLINGHYYVVQLEAPDVPVEVDVFTRTDPQLELCRISYSTRPVLQLSRNHALCGYVSKETPIYIEFSGPDLSDPEVARERSLTFGPGSARVNIANDGKMRRVTLVTSLPYGPQAIFGQGLAEWDDAGKHVDMSSINLLGTLVRDRNERLFRFNNKIYIDDVTLNGTPNVHRAIKQLRGDQLRTICAFGSDATFKPS